LVSCGCPAIPAGDRQPHRTKEEADEDPSHPAPTPKEGAMKVIPVRVPEDVADLLALVAQIEQTPVIEQVREAITEHLARKMNEGGLAERAKSMAAAIDEEANAKKATLESLLSQVSAAGPAPAKRGRARPAEPDSKAEAQVLGFSAPSRPSRSRRKEGQ
jgi:hypothetical protein